MPAVEIYLDAPMYRPSAAGILRIITLSTTVLSAISWAVLWQFCSLHNQPIAFEQTHREFTLRQRGVVDLDINIYISAELKPPWTDISTWNSSRCARATSSGAPLRCARSTSATVRLLVRRLKPCGGCEDS
jgi:hypothetical protein